jgi:hypothetical protein
MKPYHSIKKMPLAGLCAALIAAVWPAAAQVSQLGPLVELSQFNPLAGCDDGFRGLPGPISLNDGLEPFVAANPVHPNNIVAPWIRGNLQDVVAGVSIDGGKTFQGVSIPFTVCAGGSFLGAVDPRVAFAPNGDVYVIAMALNSISTLTALVSKSTDGGFHWSTPIDVTADSYLPNDEPSITPDPTDSRFVYAIWDGSQNGYRNPAVFSRTTDGGATWEPPRVIVPVSSHTFVEFSQILVLPNGTLVDLYELFTDGPNQPIKQTSLQLAKSSDHGVTWTTPSFALNMTPLYRPNGFSWVIDPETGEFVLDATDPSFAVDRVSGNLYAVWDDGRFSNFQYNDIAFSMSADGGATWSAPIRVNQTPLNIPVQDRQAFLPAMAVLADGTIGVTYYDFRFNDPNSGLPTDRWLVQCHPSANASATNPANWGHEVRLTNSSFNVEQCPFVSGFEGLLLGEYFGLTAAGNAFVASFSAVDQNGLTSAFARRVGK